MTDGGLAGLSVEEFLRRSPAVQMAPEPGATRAAEPDGYDQLTDDEVVSLIPSLEAEAAVRLRRHEATGRRRKVVIDALDRRLRALQS